MKTKTETKYRPRVATIAPMLLVALLPLIGSIPARAEDKKTDKPIVIVVGPITKSPADPPKK